MTIKNRINSIIKKSIVLSRIKLSVFQRRWKKHNCHNYTTAGRVFDISKVSVGKATYGQLDVRHFGNPEEKLIIGNYCSIGPECVFLLGGEHDSRNVSTYPYKVYYGF